MRSVRNRFVLPVIAVLLLVAGLGAVPPVALAAPARPGDHPPALPGVEAASGVGVLRSSRATVRNQAASRFRPSGTSWPAAGSGVVSLPAPAGREAAGGAGLARVAGLPVVVGATGLGRGPAAVQVAVLAHPVAAAAGVRGVVFTAQAQGAGGLVRIGLQYAGFAHVSGGNYGLSLGLEELPSCAVTSPKLAACRKAQPLSFVNDATTQTVTAEVPLPSGGSQVVLAVQSTFTDGGGSAGTYNATTLSASGTWAAGGSTGSFTYSYPMAVPPAPGGLAPQLGLSYDSGSVDGQTAATQAQPSWVGDGWNTPQAFIEQSFTSCQDSPEGSASPVSTPDECYDGPVLTLSLNGSSTPLVCPVPFSYTTNSTCTAASDNGEVITHHVSSSNGQGTQFTDYWTVTTRDGTTYSFGRNHLSGWQSGDPATNSVDWVPVFSAHSGDPCYQITGSGFTDSVCKMAYRWNLDYVTNVHDDAMAYFYQQDTNAYMEYGQTSAVSYIRDSHLYYIDYGFRGGHAYDATVADQVLFTTGDRCFAGASSCDPISSNASNWPDVPWAAEHCDDGSTSCTVVAPSYWSTVALRAVSTGQNCGAPDSSGNSTCTAKADSWALAQHFPDPGDGTSSALWLDSVTHTGLDTSTGGAAASPETVSFQGSTYQNRVNLNNGPALNRYRITGVTTEAGAQVSVTYELPYPCPNTGPSSGPAGNTSSCFPVYWGVFTPGNQGVDWFNKYAVASVAVRDTYGGSPGLSTSYQYSGAAWHFDDNEVVKTKYRTYGQWRGFQDVRTFSGSGGTDPQTETETTYYQGMSDDNNTTDVTVKDSQNNKHEDANQFAGEVLEATAYTYPGGPVDHSTINSYWVSAAAATRDRSNAGLANDPLTANFTGQVEAWTRQALTDASPASWRITETDTSLDANLTSPHAGMPNFIFAHGDINQISQERCTAITYAPANSGLNLAGLPAEIEVDALACGGSNPGGSSMPGPGQVNALTAPSGRSASNIVSDTRVFYDNPTLAQTWPQSANPAWPQTAPSTGDASVVRKATAYDSSGTATAWQTSSTAVYDSYGRVIQSYDGNGGWNGSTTNPTYTPTKTTYTQTNGSLTAETVTNPLGQSVSTTLDPLRGLPIGATDANGVTTTMQYDALGQLTSVWQYGRNPSTTPANEIFTYDLSNSSPSQVTTQTLDDAGGYVTSIALYDSLLRLRQTQTPTPQGGSLVTDYLYDSRSWQWKTNAGWWNSGANPGTCPTGTTPPCIWTVLDSQVPDQTVTQYDGLGRPVIVTSYNDSHVASTAYALYTGDKVTTVPATGATPTAGTSDALGRQTELDSYTTAPSVTTATNPGGFPMVTITGGSFQATRYAYETRGWLSAITDVATGEQWTRGYDALGQVITTSDPNAGQAQYTYDADGNVLTATGALSHTISYTYDLLSRRTGEYDGPSSTSPPIATWAYDNPSNPYSSTAVTDPIGHLTTETSYDAAGNKYILQQNGFNQFGESTSETVDIPATAATGVLGTTSCPVTTQTGCYILSHTYSTTTGLPLTDAYPASPLGTGQTSPALPAETVAHGYIPGFDLPKYLSSSLAAYAQKITWNAFFQVAQEEIGSTTAGDNAYITNTYDAHTGLLTDSNVQNTAVQSTAFDDTAYTYDPAGNLTSQQDMRAITAQSLSQTELQCFTYTLLDQLAAAWTTDGTHPCSAAPSTGSGGTVGDGVPKGAYWTSWTYTPLGDQHTQTQHSLTGGTNTVTTDTYNSNGKNQPDTLTTAATTGSSTSSYTYDPAGDTLTRNLPSGSQTLTWSDDGKLATDTVKNSTTCANGCTSSYVYDADGNLLLQADPGKTTLYVFGEQLVLNTGTGSGAGQVTGTRFIPLPGGGTVVRTGAGTSYWFEIGDQHGSSLLTLDHNAQNPTWRQFTPYGAPRGTAPTTWPDTNAFLGKPTDANTGLDIVGARNYDPTLGRFISIDPVLNAGSPQELNGYTYAADNPVSSSDPSGLSNRCDSSGCGGNPGGSTDNDPTTTTNAGDGSPSSLQNPSDGCGGSEKCVLQGLRNEQKEYNFLASAALHQQLNGCGELTRCVLRTLTNFTDPSYVNGQVQKGLEAQALQNLHAVAHAQQQAAAAAYSHESWFQRNWQTLTAVAVMLGAMACIAASAGICLGAMVAVAVTQYAMTGAATHQWGGSNLQGLGENLALAGMALPELGDVGAEDMVGAGAFCSFSPDTQVATPSGEQPIGSLKVGDQVTAYDPATGKTSTQTVEHVWINHDTDLIDLTLHTDNSHRAPQDLRKARTLLDGDPLSRAPPRQGQANSQAPSWGQNELVHTTSEHPFLTVEQGWVHAGQLTVGMHVVRVDGSTAVVTGEHVVPGAAAMWNLTISTLHTYAVGAGGYVVHNTCGKPTYVIGENMTDRVIPYAEANGLKYFRPRSVNPLRYLQNNKNWAWRIRQLGYHIIDIGPNGSVPTSRYYKAELNIFDGYPNYSTDFQPWVP